jgi:hypothetical protein
MRPALRCAGLSRSYISRASQANWQAKTPASRSGVDDRPRTKTTSSATSRRFWSRNDARSRCDGRRLSSSARSPNPFCRVASSRRRRVDGRRRWLLPPCDGTAFNSNLGARYMFLRRHGGRQRAAGASSPLRSHFCPQCERTLVVPTVWDS